MASYYNEIDPYAARWLRTLAANGFIPAGDVDERDIRDVSYDDIKGYIQCHFFAGIGGWPYACRLAGWPDDVPIWTGSCPCQPFSSAGKRQGSSDPRHLWPELFRLIKAGRPDCVMGEQVADAAGRGWLDRVCHDMEAEGYAIGAAFLPACSVGAPHERNRIWFVADADRGDSHWRTDFARRQAEGRIVADWTSQNARPWDGAIGTVDHRGIRRRTPSGVRLLANGLPGRMEQLRGYANAIQPHVGAQVIRAYMDALTLVS